MTGEQDSRLQRRTTRSMTAKAAAAGEERLRSCRHGRIGKQAERKAKKAAAAGDAKEASAIKTEEAPAPGKKMTRLPQAEVNWILAQANDGDAGLLRPPSEEDEAALAFIEIREEFFKFQAWVRSEYEKRGYVEVDEDYLADTAQIQGWIEEAREAAFRDIDFSDSDDDLKQLVMKACT